MVSMEHIDSAERAEGGGWEDSAASACAACVGEEGIDRGPPSADSIRCRLTASACRLGGPLLRLGLSKVQGMSRAAQARHGGPDSSHCTAGQPLLMNVDMQQTYLHFTYATRVAGLAQAIGLIGCVLLRLTIRLVWL